jgi:hypothetical protein
MKPDPLDFWKKYELVNTSKNFESEKIKSKVCRYCGRTNSETTFKQITHLLPELLGQNNALQTYNECDLCNNLFSKYENSLSTFVRPYITLLGIKTKKKIPKFQSRGQKEEVRTLLTHKGINEKELIIKNISDYTINPKEKTFEILFRKPPYIPLDIYKILVKIGLSLMPITFDEYNKDTFDWLVNKTDTLQFFSLAFVTMLNCSYYPLPQADLYRARKLHTDKEEFPEHILILSFANLIIQIYLPFSDEFAKVYNGKRDLQLVLFPAPAFDKFSSSNQREIKVYDFACNQPITENHPIKFSYENGDLNIPMR